mmetsp:Transcript_96075/g.296288  ORF Transcript_96075/g.296288 Transcript_96075/m.296288 type:complete len:295 (+) Transcript_96075:463-1347(+)
MFHEILQSTQLLLERGAAGHVRREARKRVLPTFQGVSSTAKRVLSDLHELLLELLRHLLLAVGPGLRHLLLEGHELGVEGGHEVRRNPVAQVLQPLLGPVDEGLHVVPRLHALLALVVLRVVVPRVLDPPLHVGLVLRGGAGDGLLLARAAAPVRDVEDAVGVDVEGHLDLRHAAGGLGNVRFDAERPDALANAAAQKDVGGGAAEQRVPVAVDSARAARARAGACATACGASPDRAGHLERAARRPRCPPWPSSRTAAPAPARSTFRSTPGSAWPYQGGSMAWLVSRCSPLSR